MMDLFLKSENFLELVFFITLGVKIEMSAEYDTFRPKTTIFAVKTTIGQEKAVLQSIFNKLRVLIPFPEVQSFMILDKYRGYIFIEANHQTDVIQLIAGVRHVHGNVVGSIELESIADDIMPKRAAEIFAEGDYVEITNGPLTGHKGYIEKMPSMKKEEIVVSITSMENPFTVKIHADYLKILEKKVKEVVQKEFKFGDALEAEEVKEVKEIKAIKAIKPTMTPKIMEIEEEEELPVKEEVEEETHEEEVYEEPEKVTAHDDDRTTFIDFGDDDDDDDDDFWGKFA